MVRPHFTPIVALALSIVSCAAPMSSGPAVSDVAAQQSLDAEAQARVQQRLDARQLQLVPLLKSGQDAQLLNYLKELYEKIQVNISNEVRLMEEVADFKQHFRSLAAPVEVLAEKHPNNEFAQFLLIQLYINQSFDARSDKPAKDLSATQQNQYHLLRDQTENAIEKMLEINPSNYLAMVAFREGYRNTFSDALKLQPASYWARRTQLHLLLPRWIGSYEKMQDAIAELDGFVDVNPSLAGLRNRILIDQADYQYRDKKYAEAAALYKESYAIGKTAIAADRLAAIARKRKQRFQACQYDKDASDLSLYSVKIMKRRIQCERAGYLNKPAPTNIILSN